MPDWERYLTEEERWYIGVVRQNCKSRLYRNAPVFPVAMVERFARTVAALRAARERAPGLARTLAVEAGGRSGRWRPGDKFTLPGQPETTPPLPVGKVRMERGREVLDTIDEQGAIHPVGIPVEDVTPHGATAEAQATLPSEGGS